MQCWNEDTGDCSSRTFEAAGDADFKRPESNSHQLSVETAESVDACGSRGRQYRSHSAVDQRSRTDSAESASFKAAPPHLLQDTGSAASGRTYCFFESIFLKSLPASPAKEVTQSIPIEVCTPLLSALPQSEAAVLKTVRPPWCSIFRCSGPVQQLRPWPDFCVSKIVGFSSCRSIACQTEPTGEPAWTHETKWESMRRDQNNSPTQRLQHRHLSQAIPSFDKELQSVCASELADPIEPFAPVEPKKTRSRRLKVLFYGDSEVAQLSEEPAVQWHEAEAYEPLYLPVKPHRLIEPVANLCDQRVTSQSDQYLDSECALFGESLQIDSFQSSSTSVCDSGCCKERGRWKPHSQQRRRPSIQASRPQNLDQNSDGCTFFDEISSSLTSLPERRQRHQRRRHGHRLNYEDIPSAGLASWSAENPSAVVEAAIAGGGFDSLLETLNRAKLRLNASDFSTAQFSPSSSRRRRRQQWQGQLCDIRSCAAACSHCSPDAGIEDNEDEVILSGADAEEADAEIGREDENQSNAVVDCNQIFASEPVYFNGADILDDCDPPGRQRKSKHHGAELMEPVPNDHTGLVLRQVEHRETELIGSVSQSLLSLTMSLESCVRQIRGTVAELQRCNDTGSM